MTSNLSSAKPVFVSVELFDKLRTSTSTGSTIVDARGSKAKAPYIPGAIVADWKNTRAGWFRDGRLMNESRARARYTNLGININHPVIIYGDSVNGWGEEGRIWWNLHYLGHPKVYILDGGIQAWIHAQKPVSSAPSSPQTGHFPTTTPRSSMRISALHLASLLKKHPIILDVRTPHEYNGSTPYFSSRGGHIPGAQNLRWKQLLSISGQLHPDAKLHALLKSYGIKEDSDIIVSYCTGGVRSAFVTAVLTHLGYDAINYDGSWWDWSSNSELPIEL